MEAPQRLPDHETFYQLLTSRHSGLIDADQQTRLRGATVLIAGCESVGANAATHLMRTGVERLILLDDRTVTLDHLAQMTIDSDSIGQNLANWLAEKLNRINPYAEITTFQAHRSAANSEPLMSDVDLVVDALGVEQLKDFRARWEIHQAAQQSSVPVVTGFDINGSGWTLVHDYRDGKIDPLCGCYCLTDLENAASETAVTILLRMMSLSMSQPDVLREAERVLVGQRECLPHSAAADALAGSFVAQTSINLLLGQPVRDVISVDLDDTIRPSEGLRGAGRKLAARLSLRRRLRQREREGRIGVYSPLDDEVFNDLRPYMEERAYEAGSVIVRQGDGSDEFFVILEGRVDIEYEEHDEDDEAQTYTVIAELGPGDYFGEMGLLTDGSRSASVVVVERCRLLTLSRGAFEMYLEESDAAATKVRDEALVRLRENQSFTGC